MKTLLVIMAHKEAQETYDRHLELWRAHGCDLVIFCPEDSIVNPRGHFLWAYGPKGHHSASANKRFKEMLFMSLKTEFDRTVVMEYDALCLTPAIPIFFERTNIATHGVDHIPGKDFTRPFIAGNVFRDNRPDRGFQGTTFIHPPLIFTRAGLRRIIPFLDALPDDAERCFWDRYLGLACENAGIEPMDFMAKGLGYAQNTIEHGQYHDAEMAAFNGALFFHGVKSEAALMAIKRGHEDAKVEGKLRHGLEIPL